jgi:hypothetical protein
MDSVIYVPDNTSNPKNFCLEYRKGSITYAVDNTSAPSKGVCLQNLVTNGDFSQGVSGWTNDNLTITTGIGKLTLVTTSTSYNNRLSQNATAIAGHKYYVNVQGKKISGSTTTLIFTDVNSYFIPSTSPSYSIPVSNTISFTTVITASTSGTDLFRFFRTNDATVGDTFELYSAMLIDLTNAFGSGNEPNQASTIDAIMNSYPNNWFNIVVKASS